MTSRAPKKLVVLGLLGTQLDQGRGSKRWEHWRPTVALGQHDELLIHRFELLHPLKFATLAETVRGDLVRVSPETTVRTHVLEFNDAWDLEEVYGGLYDFARTYPFRPDEEDYLVHITTGTHIAQICMFLLTESRHIPARLIQTSPPTHATRNSAGSYTIIDLDLSRFDRIASRFHKEQREGISLLKSGIETRNGSFNRLIERIERVAIGSREPILLMGPTGSGKSQLARRIYDLKQARRQVQGSFVEVNCATVRGDGAMSSLFGHVKGAFTGAITDRAGMLRKADGGVLFLDEIGELRADEQAMLLRAIEMKSFYPVGSDRLVQSDFQLIAGTNRDLAADVTRGTFREDLFARINLWTFRLPGLSERTEDIEPNLSYELEACARRMNLHLTFSREARTRFVDFATSPEASWNSNFRDLNAAVRRMATLSDGGRIGTDVVEEEIARLSDDWRRLTQVEGATEANHAEGPDSPLLVERSSGTDPTSLVKRYLGAETASHLDRFERVQLEDVLAVCIKSPTLSDAGRTLFNVSRTYKISSNDADRLRKYLARFALDWNTIKR
ncbi:MAG: RNA repair transcriptional activator RtcR [Polyangiaceae bacterium]